MNSVGRVDRGHRWSACADGYSCLVCCILPELEQWHFFYFVRLPLVVGVCDSQCVLEQSSSRVAVGWPGLSGETKDKTKVSLIDNDRCVSRKPLV
jgi:hypothetical protein